MVGWQSWRLQYFGGTRPRITLMAPVPSVRAGGPVGQQGVHTLLPHTMGVQQARFLQSCNIPGEKQKEHDLKRPIRHQIQLGSRSECYLDGPQIIIWGPQKKHTQNYYYFFPRRSAMVRHKKEETGNKIINSDIPTFNENRWQILTRRDGQEQQLDRHEQHGCTWEALPIIITNFRQTTATKSTHLCERSVVY